MNNGSVPATNGFPLTDSDLRLGNQIDTASREDHEAIRLSDSERYSMLDKDRFCCRSFGNGIDSMTLAAKTRRCKLTSQM